MKSSLLLHSIPVAGSILLTLSLGFGQGTSQNPPPKNSQQKPPEPTIRTGNSIFQLPHVLILAGQVAREDGHPLGGPVRVLLRCDGSIRQQEFTSVSGDFSMNVGSFSPDSVTDASVEALPPGNLIGHRVGSLDRLGNPQVLRFGSFNLAGCDLHAALPGYQSSTIQLGFRRTLDNPNVGVIKVRPLAGVHGTTVSPKTLAAPKAARIAYDRGFKELNQKKPKFKEAQKNLRKAVKTYPEFAAAWYLLGKTLLQSHDLKGARAAFRRAADADPQYVSPYLALATLAVSETNWPEAAKMSRQATEMNPYMTRGWYFRAVANLYLGQLNEAERAVQKVQSSPEATQYPSTHYLLGSIFALRKNYLSAASEYRRFLQLRPKADGADKIRGKLDEWVQKGLIKKSASSS